MNNLILHKIIIYLKTPRIAKLFFYFSDYQRLINSSNYHFDELYNLYGNKSWYDIPNNIRAVQAMFRLKIPYPYDQADPMDFAAANGHLEVVKWLHQYQELSINESPYSICSKCAMNKAAEKGHLEIIKWLHENRTEGCTIDAMNGAALNGHLEIIKWLHQNRKEGCNQWAMAAAAVEKGHLEVIKWLERMTSLRSNVIRTIKDNISYI